MNGMLEGNSIRYSKNFIGTQNWTQFKDKIKIHDLTFCVLRKECTHPTGSEHNPTFNEHALTLIYLKKYYSWIYHVNTTIMNRYILLKRNKIKHLTEKVHLHKLCNNYYNRVTYVSNNIVLTIIYYVFKFYVLQYFVYKYTRKITKSFVKLVHKRNSLSK